MFRKLSKNYDLVFQLPPLKLVIDVIESNHEEGDVLYQDQKVNYYLCEKKYIQNLHSGEREAEANVNSNHSDLILLPVVFSK